jgi:uncharacterized membrane protein YbaN (DUF454 family)
MSTVKLARNFSPVVYPGLKVFAMVALIKKYLLITAGSICLFLGILGLFLPLLPTTPFLLLAAACFFRSSERMYQWLIHHKLFGRPIKAYRQFKAVSIRAKVISLLLLWICITSSALFAVSDVWIRVVLVVIAAAVSGYILHLRTLTREMARQLND